MGSEIEQAIEAISRMRHARDAGRHAAARDAACDAVEWFREAEKEGVTSGERAHWAEALTVLADPESALQQLRMAIDSGARSSANLRASARALAAMGNARSALEAILSDAQKGDFAEALLLAEFSPDAATARKCVVDRASSLRDAAVTLELAEALVSRPDRAQDALDLLRRTSATSSHSDLLRARALEALGDLRPALVACQRAIGAGLGPQERDAHELQARLLWQLGRSEQARSAAVHAVVLGSQWPELFAWLARTAPEGGLTPEYVDRLSESAPLAWARALLPRSKSHPGRQGQILVVLPEPTADPKAQRLRLSAQLRMAEDRRADPHRFQVRKTDVREPLEGAAKDVGGLLRHLAGKKAPQGWARLVRLWIAKVGSARAEELLFGPASPPSPAWARFVRLVAPPREQKAILDRGRRAIATLSAEERDATTLQLAGWLAEDLRMGHVVAELLSELPAALRDPRRAAAGRTAQTPPPSRMAFSDALRLARAYEAIGDTRAAERALPPTATADVDAASLLDYAALAARLGHPDIAIDATCRASRVAPDDTQAYMRCAEYAATPELAARALTLLGPRGSCTADPGVALGRARLLVCARRTTEALEACVRAIVLDGQRTLPPPRPGEVHVPLPRAIELPPLPDDLLKTLEDWLERYGSSVERAEALAVRAAKSPSAHLQKAVAGVLLNASYHRLAETLYRHAFAETATPKLLRNWGVALYELGRFEEAVPRLSEAVARGDQEDALLYLAYSLQLAGRPHEGLDALARHEQDVDDPWEVRFARGYVLAEATRYEEAIAAYRSCDAIYEHPYSLHNIADIGFHRGRTVEANQLMLGELPRRYEKALADGPNPDLYLYYSECLQHGPGGSGEAYEKLKEGLKRYPDDVPLLSAITRVCAELIDQGEEAWAGGPPDRRAELGAELQVNFQRSRELLERRMTYGIAGASVELARVLIAVGAVEEAATILEKAIGERPKDHDAGILFGVALCRKGDYGGAVRWFAVAHAIDPDDVNLWSNLAEALFRSGKTDEARDHYARILAVAPAHVDSLVGLAETTMSDADAARAQKKPNPEGLYARAADLYVQAESVSGDPQHRSKRLTSKDRTKVSYAIGRALALQSEVSGTGPHAEGLRAQAARRFQNVLVRDPEHTKAREALALLTESTHGRGTTLERVVPPVVAGWAAVAQICLVFCFFWGMPIQYPSHYEMTDRLLQTLRDATSCDDVRPSQPRLNPQQVLALLAMQGKRYATQGALFADVKEAIGVEAASSHLMCSMSSIVADAHVGSSWTQREPISLPSFAWASVACALAVTVAMYMSRISKLKVGIVELENSPIEQVSDRARFISNS
jgi:tetratricopeptide (TPR) repeat protein